MPAAGSVFPGDSSGFKSLPRGRFASKSTAASVLRPHRDPAPSPLVQPVLAVTTTHNCHLHSPRPRRTLPLAPVPPRRVTSLLTWRTQRLLGGWVIPGARTRCRNATGVCSPAKWAFSDICKGGADPGHPHGPPTAPDGAKSQLVTQVPVSPPEAAPQPGHAPRTGDTAFQSPTDSPTHSPPPRAQTKAKQLFVHHHFCRRLSRVSPLQATLVLTPKISLGWTRQMFYSPRD